MNHRILIAAVALAYVVAVAWFLSSPGSPPPAPEHRSVTR